MTEPQPKNYDQLEQEVVALQDSMAILSYLVKEQQEPLDTIEEFIYKSKQNVQQGQTDLVSTEYSYSTALYVLGGMVTVAMYIFL